MQPVTDIPSAISTEDVVHRLRHTPLATLARSRAELVRMLAAVPEAHGRLRHAWTQQDPVLTAQLFSWAEQSRLHGQRTDGLVRTTANWMHDLEMVA